MDTSIVLRRLSIIKYLYQTGMQQTKLPEILAYTSILSFHDAIDMFMQLAAEKVGVVRREREQLTLIKFFPKIPELTLESSVTRLNDRRNSLKHNGQIPAKMDIEESKIVATNFFQENVKIIFDLDFNDVSLIDLVKDETVKKFLLNAQDEIKRNDYVKCSQEISKAFSVLTYVDGNPFDDLKYHFRKLFKSTRKEYKELGHQGFDRGMIKMIEGNDENFDKISSALNIISLGIDYRKYVKFDFLTPKVMRGYNGISEEVEYYFMFHSYSDRLKKEDCEFMLDFMIECAVRFSEFELE